MTVAYRHAVVDGIKIFYREAGRADAPALLLLHGFPTSSHMFRDLMPLLADRYRVVAPICPASASRTRRTPTTSPTASTISLSVLISLPMQSG